MKLPTPTFPSEQTPRALKELWGLVAQFGLWQVNDIPFELSTFEARNGMTWAVDANQVLTHSFMYVTPSRIRIAFTATNTVIGGTPNTQLFIRLPSDLIAARTVEVAGMGHNNSVGMGFGVISVAGSPSLLVVREDLGNFVAGAVNLGFQIDVDVLPNRE